MAGQDPDTKSLDKIDYVAAAARAVLGGVPFVGSLLVELCGVVIPNQRLDRVSDFARHLETQLAGVEQELLQAQLLDENFTDLTEEALRQVAQAVSEKRRKHIATILANSVTAKRVTYLESKHLLRILGQVNDVEIIRLAFYQFEHFADGMEYFRRHHEVLRPPVDEHESDDELTAYDQVMVRVSAPYQRERDRAAFQYGYDWHLASLGLIKPLYRRDSKTLEPEADSDTKVQEWYDFELTDFGLLMLREVGLIEMAG
jgi:hypothetical protein